MKQFKGIVTKISGNKCIILTSDGDFQRVPLPRGPVRVGQEISGKEASRLTGWSRYATLAACLLLVLVGLFSLQGPASAETAAYVSLDINPSLELAVDADYKVIGVKTLNKDAIRLLQSIEYKDKDVYQVLSELLEKAVELKYVSQEKSNLVVSTVVEIAPNVHLDTDRLQKAVAQPLKTRSLKVNVLFLKANKAEHDQANSLELSTGKYVLFKENSRDNSQEALNYYKTKSLASMASDHRLKIPGKHLKMVISDTSDWEEPPSMPASSTSAKQHNQWVADDADEDFKLNGKPPLKIKDNSEQGKNNRKENVREKEQPNGKEKDKDTDENKDSKKDRLKDQAKNQKQDSIDVKSDEDSAKDSKHNTTRETSSDNIKNNANGQRNNVADDKSSRSPASARESSD